MLAYFHERCDRREFLRIGGGFAAAGYLLSAPIEASPGVDASPRGARSCILVYLLGGPPHQDMFDLKPRAPEEYRGPFRPIPTNVPGIQICEHLPRLARLADRYALVRSVSRRNNNHTPMIYYTLTGRDTAQPNRDNDIRPPQRDDFPHLGAVLARFKPGPATIPSYVAMPQVAVRSSIRGQYKRARTPLRGGGAGFLGPAYDPLCVNGPPGTPEAIPALQLPERVNSDRFEERVELLRLLDQGPPRGREIEPTAAMQRRAIVLTGSNTRGRLRAFSLDDEPPRLRDRYGRHRFGQTMLLARRLAQAGVPMVAVHWNEMTLCDGWDTHSKNFDALKDELLPMLDQGLSALLEDLEDRGILDETLIVCMGEFGRTPRINRNAGRDHWGACSTTLLAGGGIRGGQVYGTSDRHAAFPERDPVDPVDIHATVYHCMGLDPQHTTIHDRMQRPFPISTGNIIRPLV